MRKRVRTAGWHCIPRAACEEQILSVDSRSSPEIMQPNSFAYVGALRHASAVHGVKFSRRLAACLDHPANNRNPS